jgi:hypothetical protein
MADPEAMHELERFEELLHEDFGFAFFEVVLLEDVFEQFAFRAELDEDIEELIVAQDVLDRNNARVMELLEDADFRFEFCGKIRAIKDGAVDDFAGNVLVAGGVDREFDAGEGAGAKIAFENVLADLVGDGEISVHADVQN